MAIKTGSLGPLLQGVSQQPDRIRLEGQVTEQINMVSDVTRGLTTRPNTVEVGVLGALPDTKFRYITLEGEEYLLEYEDDYLAAYSIEGESIPVVYSGAASNTYVGEDMRFVVVDKEIVMINRETVVEASPATAAPNYKSAVIWATAGEFSKMYRIAVTFSNNTTISADFRSPAGDQSGDGLNSTTEAIINALSEQLENHPNKPGSLTIQTRSGYLLLYHPSLSMRITTADGGNGENMKSITDSVKDPADLPRYAPNGMLVQVKSTNSTVDNYWLRYNSGGTSNGTAGFYTEGIWEEYRNPYIVERFDPTTMPHVIRRVGANLEVHQGGWLSRQVGDAKSSPMASILGKPIRDIGGFESRLVLLTPSTVVMSRTNFPYDLWRESATVISDSDPIDMTSTKKNELRLDWLVPFDRDLFVVADPGDSQFVVRGGGITPTNASMVLTTEYSIESGNTPPVSTGRTLIFPFSVGSYSGIQEYYTNNDNSAQSANGLTETLSSYILGRVDNMQVSPNFNLLVLTTDSEDETASRTVWVYKYLWDGTNIVQSCWSKWEFQESIRYHFFKNSRLYLVADSPSGQVLEYLDMNRIPGPYGYAPTLDGYSEPVAVDSGVLQEDDTTITYVDLIYEGSRFIQHTGCANPGLVVTPLSVEVVGTELRYFFDSKAVPEGATLIAGVPIEWELRPTEVFARDYQQRVDTSKNVVVQEYIVRVQNSGVVKADFISPYSPPSTYFEEMYPMDGEPVYPTGTWLVTEDLVFPWGERADWSSLRLWGDDHRPVTINEVGWAGQITAPRGTRV